MIRGFAKACKENGVALIGGETAEMPGFYQDGEYDLAGFAVGVANKPDIIDGSAVNTGDVLIGLPSSGPHSNGYSLIRKVLEKAGVTPNVDLLDDLMAPTRIYVKSVLATLRAQPGAVHAMVHVTGGGFWENLPRALKPGQTALIERDAWTWPEIFAWLQQSGNIAEDEMLRTFNCGIGFVMIVDPEQVESVTLSLRDAGEQPVVIGQVVPADTQPAAHQYLTP